MLFCDQQTVARTFSTTQDFKDQLEFEVQVHIRGIHISGTLSCHHGGCQRLL